MIRASGLGKCYRIFDSPTHRLKEALWGRYRSYGRDFWAIRDVSFELREGETLGVIGRNGSGKSTLLQILCGTLRPSEGEVRMGGTVSALLELGAGFNPEFTGRENVTMAGLLAGLNRRRIAEQFDRIVAFADIGDFVDQPVKMYSSGMYVRLAFAVAISVDPRILVVDEALAVGDIFFQQKCMKYMREQMGEATKVLVTHDMQAVTNLADRVLVLDRGRVAFEGPPLEAIEHYTKTLHNALFRDIDGDAEPDRPPAAADMDRAIAWIDVPEESRSGAGQARITHIAVTGTDGEPIECVEADQAVVVRCQLEVTDTLDDVFFGYIVNDRMGNAIFGENTCVVPHGRVSLTAGCHLVQVEFKWPEIQPGPYTTTLGVGQGRDPMDHTIQCWAHNVAALTAISPRRAVHGLFNNPLRLVEVAPLGT